MPFSAAVTSSTRASRWSTCRKWPFCRSRPSSTRRRTRAGRLVGWSARSAGPLVRGLAFPWRFAPFRELRKVQFSGRGFRPVRKVLGSPENSWKRCKVGGEGPTAACARSLPSVRPGYVDTEQLRRCGGVPNTRCAPSLSIQELVGAGRSHPTFSC